MSSGEPDWWHKQFQTDFKADSGAAKILDLEAKLAHIRRESLKFENQLLQREFEDLKEEKARLESPALMDAWEKYQALLKLTKK